MKVFGSFGYDYFFGIKDYPNEFAAINVMFGQFLKQYLNDYYTDEAKSLSKQLKKANNEKVSLMKSIDKNRNKLVGINKKLDMMNANKEAGLLMDVKHVEKMGNITEDKNKLENANTESLLSVLAFETIMQGLEKKLDKIAKQYKGLIQ